LHIAEDSPGQVVDTSASDVP